MRHARVNRIGVNTGSATNNTSTNRKEPTVEFITLSTIAQLEADLHRAARREVIRLHAEVTPESGHFRRGVSRRGRYGRVRVGLARRIASRLIPSV